MFSKSSILICVLLVIADGFGRDKRTDFIPSHPVSKTDTHKISVVGKGNVKQKKVDVNTVPSNELADEIQSGTKQNDKLRAKKSVKRNNRNTKHSDKVTERRQAKEKNESEKINATVSDSSLTKSQSEKTDTLTQSRTITPVKVQPTIIARGKNGNEVLFRSINVVALIIVLASAAVVWLQLSGYFSKRKPKIAVSTFMTDIVDTKGIDNELLSYQRPAKKDIFATISNREEDDERIVVESEDEMIERGGPINYETVQLASKFGRGHGEIDLSMKMMTHRNSAAQSSRYSSQAALIEQYENEETVKRKKDAGVLAKKLGVGKGEVLLSRHLEKIEQQIHTRG